MQTKLLYLEHSYVQTMTAKVVSVTAETPGRWKIVLDQTVFYPLGGGQPTDQGTLVGEGWSGSVNQVLLKEGEICHFVDSATEPPVGITVVGTLDWPRRFLNMRRHSAAHVIDFAMYQLGYAPKPLYPTKGDHSKKCFIIYEGTMENDIKAELEAKSNELVKADLVFSTRFVTFDQIKEIALYLQPGLPQNKPLRVLALEGVGAVADGGTQVERSSEVGVIKIPKIEVKDGFTTIHYTI
ncbi:MAG: alanyl-tRNA editing protein [Chlamydiales bacterium]|nr:alanyl-tRNA editing protein [Chlamydiales bacterium]